MLSSLWLAGVRMVGMRCALLCGESLPEGDPPPSPIPAMRRAGERDGERQGPDEAGVPAARNCTLNFVSH